MKYPINSSNITLSYNVKFVIRSWALDKSGEFPCWKNVTSPVTRTRSGGWETLLLVTLYAWTQHIFWLAPNSFSVRVCQSKNHRFIWLKFIFSLCGGYALTLHQAFFFPYFFPPRGRKIFYWINKNGGRGDKNTHEGTHTHSQARTHTHPSQCLPASASQTQTHTHTCTTLKFTFLFLFASWIVLF